MNNVQASSSAVVAEATDDTAEKEKTKALLTRQLKNETDSVKASITKFASQINDLEDKSIPSAQARYYRESMDMCAAKIEARIFKLSTNFIEASPENEKPGLIEAYDTLFVEQRSKLDDIDLAIVKKVKEDAVGGGDATRKN